MTAWLIPSYKATQLAAVRKHRKCRDCTRHPPPSFEGENGTTILKYLVQIHRANKQRIIFDSVHTQFNHWHKYGRSYQVLLFLHEHHCLCPGSVSNLLELMPHTAWRSSWTLIWNFFWTKGCFNLNTSLCIVPCSSSLHTLLLWAGWCWKLLPASPPPCLFAIAGGWKLHLDALGSLSLISGKLLGWLAKAAEERKEKGVPPQSWFPNLFDVWATIFAWFLT